MLQKVILGDNIIELPKVERKSVSLIYIDPPFNTGNTQTRQSGSYEDHFDKVNFQDYLLARIEEARKCLTDNGSLFVHLDHHEVHYVKVDLDNIFGRNRFMNEIIWAYDYGGRSKHKWPTKHDSILWYVNNPEDYIFNYDAMDRIPYMAPSLVGEAKAERGKTLTDVWWHTIVPTMSKENNGYPTQKPLGLLNRIIKVHSNLGDTVLDFFAGSGTTGEAAIMNGRGYVLIDKNPQAIAIINKRLSKYHAIS